MKKLLVRFWGEVNHDVIDEFEYLINEIEETEDLRYLMLLGNRLDDVINENIMPCRIFLRGMYVLWKINLINLITKGKFDGR